MSWNDERGASSKNMVQYISTNTVHSRSTVSTFTMNSCFKHSHTMSVKSHFRHSSPNINKMRALKFFHKSFNDDSFRLVELINIFKLNLRYFAVVLPRVIYHNFYATYFNPIKPT